MSNDTRIVEMPFVYQVEAILKGKRKPKMYAVISYMPVEIKADEPKILALYNTSTSMTSTIFPLYYSKHGCMNFAGSTILGTPYTDLPDCSEALQDLIKSNVELNMDYRQNVELFGGLSFSDNDDFKTIKEKLMSLRDSVFGFGHNEIMNVEKTLSEDELTDARQIISDNKSHAQQKANELYEQYVMDSNNNLYPLCEKVPSFKVSMSAGLLQNYQKSYQTQVWDHLYDDLSIEQTLEIPMCYTEILNKYVALNTEDAEKLNDSCLTTFNYMTVNSFIVVNDKLNTEDMENIFGPPEKILFDAVRRINSTIMPYSRAGATIVLQKLKLHDILQEGIQNNYDQDSIDKLFMVYQTAIDQIAEGKHYYVDDNEINFIKESYRTLQNLKTAIDYYHEFKNVENTNNLFKTDEDGKMFLSEHSDEIYKIKTVDDFYMGKEPELIPAL